MNPPNATVSVLSKAGDSVRDAVLVLREPHLDGTGRGHFGERLTQITLHRLRLLAAEEHLPWIAFVAVPADAFLVLMAISGGSSPIWGGIGMRAGEIITVGPDQRVHARTDGPCRRRHHLATGPGRGPIWRGAERRRDRRSSIRRAMATPARGS
jgi:hypothetical protein